MKPSPMVALLGLVVAALLLADASCSDTTASGMTITVQRWDSVNKCFGTTTFGDPPQPGVRLETCPAAPATDFVGGVDQIRMVVDYGDLEFSASTQPPAPTVTMTLDGVGSPTGASATLAQAASPTVFFAVLTAPARPVNQMFLGASVTTGFTHAPIGPIQVDAPSATVSVQQCAADAGSCSFVSGVGSATVMLTAPGTAAASGTITWSLNGVLQAGSVPVALTLAPNAVNTIMGVANVPVPVTPDGTSWTLDGQVGSASGSGPSMTIHAPTPTIVVENCQADAGPCDLTAAVGSAAVAVTAPGTGATSGTIASSLNGTPQPGTFTVSLAPAPNLANTLSGIAFVPVPVAADGALWSLSAQVGAVSSAPTTLTLRAPKITSSLAGCGSGACTVPAGATVSFTVTAPLGIATQQATVSTAIGNTAALAPLMVALSASDIAANAVSGTVALTAPMQSGATWLINANVDGYPAPTIVAMAQ